MQCAWVHYDLRDCKNDIDFVNSEPANEVTVIWAISVAEITRIKTIFHYELDIFHPFCDSTGHAAGEFFFLR